jgi:hypothetical protein
VCVGILPLAYKIPRICPVPFIRCECFERAGYRSGPEDKAYVAEPDFAAWVQRHRAMNRLIVEKGAVGRVQVDKLVGAVAPLDLGLHRGRGRARVGCYFSRGSSFEKPQPARPSSIEQSSGPPRNRRSWAAWCALWESGSSGTSRNKSGRLFCTRTPQRTRKDNNGSERAKTVEGSSNRTLC